MQENADRSASADKLVLAVGSTGMRDYPGTDGARGCCFFALLSLEVDESVAQESLIRQVLGSRPVPNGTLNSQSTPSRTRQGARAIGSRSHSFTVKPKSWMLLVKPALDAATAMVLSSRLFFPAYTELEACRAQQSLSVEEDTRCDPPPAEAPIRRLEQRSSQTVRHRRLDVADLRRRAGSRRHEGGRVTYAKAAWCRSPPGRVGVPGGARAFA